MADIVIEKAKPEDVEGMQEVFYRSWLATYPNAELGITEADIEERFKNRRSPEVLAKRRERTTNPIDGETWLVAKQGNLVVGLVSPVKTEDKNQLQRIYVHPDHQNQGVGTRLWEAAQEYMDMRKDTYVNLVEYNAQAKRFYEKLGFRDTGRRWPSTTLIFKSGKQPTEMEMVRKAEK